MEDPIIISNLNDFTFCPVSIYFHNVMGNQDSVLVQTTSQINGKSVHSNIDQQKYSTKKSILQGIDIYSDELGLIGKIDLFDISTGLLTERKRKINRLFDGQIFQMYAQYYCLTEMGYSVKQMKIHSIADNRNYEISLPNENIDLDNKFKKLIEEIHNFNFRGFVQNNSEKCSNCIYSVMCSYQVVGKNDVCRGFQQ